MSSFPNANDPQTLYLQMIMKQQQQINELQKLIMNNQYQGVHQGPPNVANM